MSDAYKCDGCGEFRKGQPELTLIPTYGTMSDPPQWDLCEWGCLHHLVHKQVGAMKEQNDD